MDHMRTVILNFQCNWIRCCFKERFNNEEEDHDPSSSGLHCRPQDFSVDVGDSNNGRNSVDSSTEKDGDTSLDSGSTQKVLFMESH